MFTVGNMKSPIDLHLECARSNERISDRTVLHPSACKHLSDRDAK
jgi:hypothetical protein